LIVDNGHWLTMKKVNIDHSWLRFTMVVHGWPWLYFDIGWICQDAYSLAWWLCKTMVHHSVILGDVHHNVKLGSVCDITTLGNCLSHCSIGRWLTLFDVGKSSWQCEVGRCSTHCNVDKWLWQCEGRGTFLTLWCWELFNHEDDHGWPNW
jgi:hypothetical protein